MKNILVKISGDASDNPGALKFIKEKSKSNKIVVICGGGTQINEALAKKGFKIKFDIHGRVINSKKEDKIVRKILEKERKDLQKEFNKNVAVLSPIISAGLIFCHINGDNLVKAFYLGFDEIFVFTLKNRMKNKKDFFKSYPKVKVIGI